MRVEICLLLIIEFKSAWHTGGTQKNFLYEFITVPNSSVESWDHKYKLQNWRDQSHHIGELPHLMEDKEGELQQCP